MSNDDFITYLKSEGLQEVDCLRLSDNCIGAKVFGDLTEENVNDTSLGFSFGGKILLKKILAKIKSGSSSAGASVSESAIRKRPASFVAFRAGQHFTAQQPQSQQTPNLTQEVPHQFSETMNNEELVLWLSDQPVLVGTNYFADIIEVIKGERIDGRKFLSLDKDHLKNLSLSVDTQQTLVNIINSLKPSHTERMPFCQDQSATSTDRESLKAAALHPPSTYVQESQGFLNITHLYGVQVAIWDARAKWYNIGLGLGLSADTLDAIAKAHLQQPEECLTDVIKRWLRSEKPWPTWEALFEVLKSPVVDYAHLAESLPK